MSTAYDKSEFIFWARTWATAIGAETRKTQALANVREARRLRAAAVGTREREGIQQPTRVEALLDTVVICAEMRCAELHDGLGDS